MTSAFVSLIRLAGLNVGLTIVGFVILGILSIIALRLLRALVVAAFVLMLMPFALASHCFLPPPTFETDEDRVTRQRLRAATERTLANALRICDGGRYGRERRMMRRLAQR